MSKFFILLVLTSMFALGQNFEGKVIYKNSYESKIPNLTNVQLSSLMGTIQEYVIKENNYKSSFNGVSIQYQLYRGDENRIYNKFSSANALYWSDGHIEGEKITEVIEVENKENVLGISCNELTIKTTRGHYIYYYSSKYSINPDFFKSHAFGNWNFYVEKAKAIPLKIIMDTPEFKSISTAIKIMEEKIGIQYFSLPKNLAIKSISELKQ